MSIKERFFSCFTIATFFLFSALHGWEAELKQKIASGNPPSWAIEQIQEDLSSFLEAGVTHEMLDATMQLNENQGRGLLFARFQVVNNEIFVLGNVQDWVKVRLAAITNALRALASVVQLPNLDFIVTLHDALDRDDLPSPIFGFAKDYNLKKLILIPDFEALSDRAPILAEVKQGERQYPWEQKLSIAVWRGSMTGGMFSPENFLSFPRSRAVTLSLQFPSLINARFTQLCQCTNPKKVKKHFEDYFGNQYTITKQMKYKYQVLIDGNSCAYSGAYWRLFSNCVVLKQSSPNIQWYYKGLVPNVHYIPVQSDLSDLIQKIRWAQEHDQEARIISHKAQEFANGNLTYPDILYYVYLLLTEYAKLQSF